MITLKIPVPAHVSKYLVGEYGPEHTLSKTSSIGKLLFSVLNNDFVTPDKKKEAAAGFNVTVPVKYFNEGRHTLGLRQLETVARYMVIAWKEDFLRYVDREVGKGTDAMQAIRLFMAEYDITEDDIKLETLYKKYQRHSKNDIRKAKTGAANRTP